MFIDEELEQILLAKEVKTKEDAIELQYRLLNCMINRVPFPFEVSTHDYLTEIKKIDNGWRLLCKKHPTLNLNKDFWRNQVLRSDVNGNVKKILGW